MKFTKVIPGVKFVSEKTSRLETTFENTFYALNKAIFPTQQICYITTLEKMNKNKTIKNFIYFFYIYLLKNKFIFWYFFCVHLLIYKTMCLSNDIININNIVCYTYK